MLNSFSAMNEMTFEDLAVLVMISPFKDTGAKESITATVSLPCREATNCLSGCPGHRVLTSKHVISELKDLISNTSGNFANSCDLLLLTLCP